LLQTLGAEEKPQPSLDAGNWIRNPVCWVVSEVVRALDGNGPTVVESGWKSTEVGAAQMEKLIRISGRSGFMDVPYL
jgi:hypothetical protein